MAERPQFAKWLPQHPELGPFYSGVHAYLVKMLKHPDKAEHAPTIESGKSILDPVLGYVYLLPMEVTFLDTQLFQRLRKITQLGLASLVYPSLGYSRFEHTIGVIGRLAQVLSTLANTHRRRENGLADPLVTATIEEYEATARLAALFHDVGHTLFSHASERVIEKLTETESRYPSAQIIKSRFDEQFGKSLGFAEVFSLTIMGDPQILSIVSRFEKGTKPARMLEQAAGFVTGRPVRNQPQTLFLAQLISGGLDVDKLDYMSREAYFSGLKLEIDLERILDKIRVYTASANDLPKELVGYKSLFEEGSNCKILGLAKGGQFSFEEFCISRLALWEKIYLQQKVRAAESQLSKYLEELPIRHDVYRRAHVWLQLPESIIYDSSPVVSVALKEATVFDQGDLDELREIPFHNIGQRNIVRRVFGFGPANSISDAPITDANPDPASWKFIERTRGQIEELRESILAEAGKIAELEQTVIPLGYAKEVLIDMPRYKNVQQGHNSLHFETPHQLATKWTIPIDRIVPYYRNNKALGYVYAQHGVEAIISLAAEKVIYRQSGGQFIQQGVVSSSLTEQIKELKSKLNDKNYYEDTPELKPLPPFLQTVAAHEIINRIVTRFMLFHTVDGSAITAGRVLNFLQQFEPDLIPAALEFLDHLELVSMDKTRHAIDTALTRSASGDKILLSPLGGAKDSGTHLTYKLKTYEQFRERPIFPISDREVEAHDHIIFFDDNVNSGMQVLNIFKEWLGTSLPERLTLNEEHVKRLGETACARIKSIKISLAYGVGPEGAEREIKSLLKEHCGIDGNCEVFISERLLKEKRIFSGEKSAFNHPKKRELEVFLRQKGQQILAAEGRTADFCQENCLGFAATEAMVAFAYNVPTMTITPLWCSNAGLGWKALFHRIRHNH